MTRLDELRESVEGCRNCELYRDATQAVFSAGRASASIMLVGEQPGDREDLEGEPFVGPAGRVLDEALELAGVARSDVYLTNAVKHFRFEQRGKRRIHQKPGITHIEACHPWLQSELEVVRPSTVVCLGATAGRSVLGRPVKIGAERGQVIDDALPGAAVVVTTHPSSLLRLRDRGDYADELRHLADDLRLAAGVR
ncbi:UdgX family uracil-DNA binding protein [Aeromicrobium sp. Marseille-Q0843]|uniref:Type-4 uracil-DNA glycosylase n=1 Tax=Aeromicrobium phoceense TaxID=2754045 RepID=A0A838XSI8_9ACTN|nr:UdgX family uracil-DNA binding protein [Aeromicrobium phoceense]